MEMEESQSSSKELLAEKVGSYFLSTARDQKVEGSQVEDNHNE